MIFVFGSNLAGRHGKGAALHAAKFYGAERGIGEGRTGMAYAIPTKGRKLEVLPLDEIESSIIRFAAYASIHYDENFAMTPIGCGLAGYSKRDIWTILARAGLTKNVYLTREWLE
jgi:hypothetical protein